MVKNKLKRYSGIHELELDLEDMNNNGWSIQSISDIGNRMLVVYTSEVSSTSGLCLDMDTLTTNSTQDAETKTLHGEEKNPNSNNGGASL